jgi:ribosomal protein S2
MKKKKLRNLINYYDSRESICTKLSTKLDSNLYKNTFLNINFYFLKLKAYYESLYLFNKLILYYSNLKDSILIIEDRPYLFDIINQFANQKNIAFYLGKWTNGFLTNFLFKKDRKEGQHNLIKTNLTQMPTLVIIINSLNIINIINECIQKGIPYIVITDIKRNIKKVPYPLYCNSDKLNFLIQ